jgi:protein gp37
MSDGSTIEWTDATWNPVTGCTKISPGCKFCYAEKFAERFRGVAGHPYEQGFDLRLWPDRLALPLNWKTPRMVFVNSMSDLFHDDIPDAYVGSVFDVMEAATLHTFQVLTKRADRMVAWTSKRYRTSQQSGGTKRPWPSNVWAGVSVESNKYLDRIEQLRRVPASIRFISFEPLLELVDIAPTLLRDIHWVIVGGESGPGARRMEAEWARHIHRACRKADVAFFFKQWGAFNPSGRRVGKKVAGRILDGKTWSEFPELLGV